MEPAKPTTGSTATSGCSNVFTPTASRCKLGYWQHYNGKTHAVYRPRHMTPDELMAGYEWAKTQFYSPGSILRRMAKSKTGLWWNVPRNLGYTFGLTGEVRARAAMHEGEGP